MTNLKYSMLEFLVFFTSIFAGLLISDRLHKDYMVKHDLELIESVRGIK